MASIKFVSVVLSWLMNGVERFGETQRVTHVLSINLWIFSPRLASKTTRTVKKETALGKTRNKGASITCIL